MEGPRSVNVSEFKDTIKLVNKVFRTSANEEATMQQEFSLLLNQHNIKNMYIIKEDKKVVSNVTYSTHDIKIQGAKIKAASIGAICTLNEYRNRGFASQLLEHAEAKMLNDDIDVAIISGEDGIWHKMDWSSVNSHNKYTVKADKCDIDFKIEPYSEDYLNKIIHMYSQKCARCSRTFEDFKTLLKESDIPNKKYKYHKYVLVREDQVIGYIFVREIHGECNYGEVFEWFGNPSIITGALKNIADDLTLEYINHYVNITDHANQLNDAYNTELGSIYGSLKIINFPKFMENLKPYFALYVDECILENISFECIDDKFIFSFKDEQLIIDSYAKLNNIIFEKGQSSIDYSCCPNIKLFVENVFPLPFIWNIVSRIPCN